MATPEEELRALGLAVCERRRALNLSEAEAATRWGVDRSWLSDVERGRGDPTFESILALAAEMGVTLTELFRRAEELRGRRPDS